MSIPAPASFHWPTAKIIITAYHNEGGNLGRGDTILISLNISPYPTFPWAIITTNPDAVATQKLVFSGTPIFISKADSNGVVQTLDNTFVVSHKELTVQRHGNSIIVDFNPKNTITLNFPNTPYWPKDYITSIPNPHPPPATIPYTVKPALYPLVLPAFHLEIDKYGVSFHEASSKTFASSDPNIVLSGYTINSKIMGFHGDATFTCSAWSNPATSDAFVIMHGKNTIIPP